MKKQITILLIIVISMFSGYAIAEDDDDAYTIFFATSTIGGGLGSLDGAVSGVSIGPYDKAIVVDAAYGTLLYEAKLDTAAENDPLVVRPDDVGAGVTSWHLAASGVSGFLKIYGGHVSADTYIEGGVSKFYVYSGTTLTSEMLAGGMIFVHTDLGSAPTVLGIPYISSSTPFFGVWDMTGGGVRVQTTDGQIMYDDDETGTAYFVNEGNSRHSASFTLNSESGSCTYVVVIGSVGSNWNME